MEHIALVGGHFDMLPLVFEENDRTPSPLAPDSAATNGDAGPLHVTHVMSGNT